MPLNSLFFLGNQPAPMPREFFNHCHLILFFSPPSCADTRGQLDLAAEMDPRHIQAGAWGPSGQNGKDTQLGEGPLYLHAGVGQRFRGLRC